jgi:hypothetical protein
MPSGVLDLGKDHAKSGGKLLPDWDNCRGLGLGRAGYLQMP